MSCKAPRPGPGKKNRPAPPRVPTTPFAGCLLCRQLAKQEPISKEERDRLHEMVNTPGYINCVYGAYNSKG